MFNEATSFNIDVSGWDTGKVTDMSVSKLKDVHVIFILLIFLNRECFLKQAHLIAMSQDGILRK